MEKKELKKELFEKYNWDRFFTEKVKEDVWEWVEDKLDKAREEERKIMIKTIESMKYKGDIEEFKHIKTAFDCKTVEEYVWFIGSMTLNRVISKLKDNK